MKLSPSDWFSPTCLADAMDIQRQLADRVVLTDDFSEINLIGGMDVSNHLYDPHAMVYASAIILKKQTLTLQEQATAAQAQSFPYRSGFLSFREIPSLLEAFKKLKNRPEMILVDGHGISHPRRLGIASHLGVLLDIPTIGVAKSILVGHPAGPLGENKGNSVPLLWKGECIGACLRTKTHCHPLIISTGHRVSLESAIDIVLQCISCYRLSEPTRHAHLAANHCRKNTSASFR